MILHIIVEIPSDADYAYGELRLSAPPSGTYGLPVNYPVTTPISDTFVRLQHTGVNLSNQMKEMVATPGISQRCSILDQWIPTNECDISDVRAESSGPHVPLVPGKLACVNMTRTSSSSSLESEGDVNSSAETQCLTGSEALPLLLQHVDVPILPTPSVSPVMLFGVEVDCPAFTEGVNEIVCKINKTAISQSKCQHVQAIVTFERTRGTGKNKKQSTVCQADNVCDPAKSLSPRSCCCDDSDPEIKICKFSHVADRSYDEGTRLECIHCPEQADYVDVTDQSCRNISFADPLFSEGRTIEVTPAWLIGVIFYILCGM